MPYYDQYLQKIMGEEKLAKKEINDPCAKHHRGQYKHVKICFWSTNLPPSCGKILLHQTIILYGEAKKFVVRNRAMTEWIHIHLLCHLFEGEIIDFFLAIIQFSWICSLNNITHTAVVV